MREFDLTQIIKVIRVTEDKGRYYASIEGRYADTMGYTSPVNALMAVLSVVGQHPGICNREGCHRPQSSDLNDQYYARGTCSVCARYIRAIRDRVLKALQLKQECGKHVNPKMYLQWVYGIDTTEIEAAERAFDFLDGWESRNG